MPSLKDDLENILSGSICLERLTEPKLLPCCHRFCKLCLRQEMDRSATSGPAPSFPCPLCKRMVYLPRGRQGKERIDCFETDRLLKDVLERLDGVEEGSPDVCSPHRDRLEIVCYSCRVTGCMRCAWEKHRHCIRTEPFMEEVERIERDLRQQLNKTEQNLCAVTSRVRILTTAKKSYKNQIQYSNKFIDKCIQEKRDRFNSVHSRLVDLIESKKSSGSKKIQRLIGKILQTLLTEQDIESKCEMAVLRLKKNNLSFSRHVERASLQIQSLPDTQQLTRVAQAISETLQLKKREMVFKEEQILELTNGVPEFSGLSCNDDMVFSPDTLVLEGLITREEQVHLDLEEQEKVLNELIEIVNSADDPRSFMTDLQRFHVSQNAGTKPLENLTPTHSQSTPSFIKEPTGILDGSSFRSRRERLVAEIDRDLNRRFTPHASFLSYFCPRCERSFPVPLATYVCPRCDHIIHRGRRGEEWLCCLSNDRHPYVNQRQSGNGQLKAITSGHTESEETVKETNFGKIVVIVLCFVFISFCFTVVVND